MWSEREKSESEKGIRKVRAVRFFLPCVLVQERLAVQRARGACVQGAESEKTVSIRTGVFRYIYIYRCGLIERKTRTTTDDVVVDDDVWCY